MAADLGIVNTYPVRRTLESMSQRDRTAYFERLVETQRPELCLLPQITGNHIPNLLSGQYKGYTPVGDGKTILLFDINRVHLQRVNINEYSTGYVDTLNLDKIICTKVQIQSPGPAKTTSLEFNHITWERGVFSRQGRQNSGDEDVNEDKTLFEKFIALCQIIAMKLGVPVIISGENSLYLKEILAILKKTKTTLRNSFLNKQQENLEECGFLPSMTKGSTREFRDLFEFKPVCTKGNEESCRMSDFVMASKRLQMTDPSPIQASSVFGSTVSSLFFNGVCPLAMGLMYAARPPKHFGG